MRKSIVAILAVAIIGVLGVYGKSHSGKASATLGASSNSSQSSTTASNSNPSSPNASSNLKDGTYTGDREDTPYGTVQIAVVVSGGQISDIRFLQMPNDLGHTQEVTAASEPLLKQETLQKQSAHIDFVSGATSTSEGYQQSLQSALDQAV